MVYVELLRVRNALRIMGYVLAALFLFAVVGRITMSRQLTYQSMVRHVAGDAGTRMYQNTLADGTHRVRYDDPDGTQVTVDDRGYEGKRITILEPTTRAKRAEHVTAGVIQVSSSDDGKMRRTVIETDGQVPYSPFLAIGAFFGLIVATLLGAPLARENDGHLEYAFLKPVSRTALALRIIAIDAAGIVVAVIATSIAFVIMLSIFETPHLAFDETVLPIALNAFVIPLAWYAMLAACTSSLRRGYAAILGFSWPVWLAIGGLALAPLGDSSLAHLISGTFRTLSYLSPLHYASFHVAGDQGSVRSLPTYLNAFWPAILALAYWAASVLQWRRVQA